MIRSEEKLTLEDMYLTEKKNVEDVCKRAAEDTAYLSDPELRDKWIQDFMDAWDMGYKKALANVQRMLMSVR